MEMLTPNLTHGQLEILKIMARPMTEEDLSAIKNLIIQYFADKLTKLADDVWEKNQWSEEKEEELIHTHLRTSR